MTIKQRLFISNMCMVVLSVLALFIAGFSLLIFVVGIEGFNMMNSQQSMMIAVDQVVYFDTNTDTFSQDDVVVYQLETGQYVLTLPEGLHELFENLNESSDIVSFDLLRLPQQEQQLEQRLESIDTYGLPIILTIVLVFGLLANLIFRKFVLNPIKKSIADLEIGVDEISDGNLTYRIEHERGNEFDGVCKNFNEMANRLLEMTEQKQADENSRKELIAGISHDLKTPLTSINAYAEGIKKGVATTPEMQEKYMTIIQSKAQEMTYIINHLFLFSKIDLGEFPFQIETVDIGLEVEKMVTSFIDDYAQNDVCISLSKNVTQIFVAIDMVQFKNVVQNIVGNSIKYGTKVDGKIDIRCEKQNNNIAIIIKDNGSGVTDEILKHMFDIFYRGDASRNNAIKGSGLGLAISSKIIKRLNGTIEADHSPSGGLVTTIRLPIVKEDI